MCHWAVPEQYKINNLHCSECASETNSSAKSMLERETVQKIIAKNNCEYISVMNLSQSCTHIHREYRALGIAQSWMGERGKETERKKNPAHWPWFHSISNYILDVVIWILYKEQQEYKIDANKIVKISKIKKSKSAKWIEWEIELVGEKKNSEREASTYTHNNNNNINRIWPTPVLSFRYKTHWFVWPTIWMRISPSSIFL